MLRILAATNAYGHSALAVSAAMDVAVFADDFGGCAYFHGREEGEE